MDEVTFHREPPTNVPTIVVAFGGWVDAGEAATGAMRYLAVSTGPSSSLGFMPPMEGGPDQWSPPREPTLYFMVQDVDAAYRTLSNRGVSFDEPPRDMPWGHRVARLKDPEGRRVCLAQQKMK